MNHKNGALLALLLVPPPVVGVVLVVVFLLLPLTPDDLFFEVACSQQWAEALDIAEALGDEGARDPNTDRNLKPHHFQVPNDIFFGCTPFPRNSIGSCHEKPDWHLLKMQDGYFLILFRLMVLYSKTYLRMACIPLVIYLFG